MDGHAGVVLGEGPGFDPGEDAALGLDAHGDLHHLGGGCAEVDDARTRHPQPLHSADMGLDFAHGVTGNALKAFDFVLLSEAVDLLEHGQLVGCGGGHDLSADIVVDMVFLGKSHQLMAPLDAIDGLQAARGG